MASALSPDSWGTKRALVIGNNAYELIRLRYCVNDATDMCNKLREINFEVTRGIDLTYEAMKSMIDNFIRSIRQGDLVVFHFAGHGTQWNDQNYLLPIDNHQLTNPSNFISHAINAQSVLKSIMDRHPYAAVFLLDCCRNYLVPNPAVGGNQRSAIVPQGLVTMKVAGSYIAFACAANTIAQDGSTNGRNGLFTAHLLEHIAQSNVSLGDVMYDVRNGVTRESRDVQWPFCEDSLRLKVYLNYTNTSPHHSIPSNTGIRTHIIQFGESFWVLAPRYGCTADDLIALNPGIDPKNLQLEQTIRVPGHS